MAESITYQDPNYAEITEADLLAVSWYTKIFSEDGNPVKEERYENGNLVNNSYHVSTQQQIDHILKDNLSVSFQYRYTKNIMKL